MECISVSSAMSGTHHNRQANYSWEVCLIKILVSNMQIHQMQYVLDASPELLSWFTEKTLQPGPALSLKCSAAGNPPPQFTWSLDGFPLPDNNRYKTCETYGPRVACIVHSIDTLA